MSSIIIPAGDWEFGFSTILSTGSSSSSQIQSLYAALSTSSSSISDAGLVDFAAISLTKSLTQKFSAQKDVNISSEETYYLIVKSVYDTLGLTLYGTVTPTRIYAVWGGL
jgi:hypothetical protein